MVELTKGEQTREMIIEEAAKVFNQRGYAGTSMADIMEVTGLAKGGIYRHFAGGKDELALHAFDHALNMMTGYFRDALEGQDHARDKLFALLDMWDGFALEYPIPGGCPALNTAIKSDGGQPELVKRSQDAFELWHKLIRVTLKKGIKRGELQGNIDPDAFASLLISTVEGGLMLSRLYQDEVHMQRATGHLREVIDGFVTSA